MWMDREIRSARCVLMVCTETYFRRVMGEEKPGSGLGVQWEGKLIYQHLYNAAVNDKFIPVLVSRSHGEFIPTPVQGATRYCFTEPDGYRGLCNGLLGRPPAAKPPLGKRRPVPPLPTKTNVAAFLSSPIDIPLWDAARWRATFFLMYKERPPVIGLAFENEAPAREIFSQWHQRYGANDDFEELRISIVEGDIKGQDPGYTVHVSPELENLHRRYKAYGFNPDADIIYTITRMNRMNPTSDSPYLRLFKDAYRHFKTYLLAPGVVAPDGSQLRPLLDLGIRKGRVHFRQAADIGPHDIDYAVIGAQYQAR